MCCRNRRAVDAAVVEEEEAVDAVVAAKVGCLRRRKRALGHLEGRMCPKSKSPLEKGAACPAPFSALAPGRRRKVERQNAVP